MPSEPSRLKESLAALDHARPPGDHGRSQARRRAQVLDATLEAMFAEAGSPAGVAVCAVGGYGRCELLPHSDVDLLILHDATATPEDLAALTSDLLYPLWDAGLEVGQAVRTTHECVAIAAERIDALTAMLDLRHLAGDAELSAAAHAGVLTLVRPDPLDFARRLHEAGAERHARYGSAGHELEPELKEGAGGLRDEASLGWLTWALGGPLESAGLLRPRERQGLDAAAEFLTRVRSALHLETGKRTDRLLLEHQPSVARAMGFSDAPRLIAEDALVRTVFEHARRVASTTEWVYARLLGGGATDVPEKELPDAAGVLTTIARAAGAHALASPALLDAMDVARVPDPVVWTPDVLAAFLELLRSGDAGADALETLDGLGLLTRYLPAWADVRCRPQRDPYHRASVDVHLRNALREMGRMLAAHDVEDPLEAEAVSLVADSDGARLGALLHDIGKIGEGGHVAAGLRIVAETLRGMGVRGATSDLVTFMVAEHLLLPDTATRRDLGDENLVLDVAARIGSPERLAALYLLAKADALATGPAAWTPWRRSLLHELVGKVYRVFERGEMGVELAERLTDRVGRVRDRLAAEPESEVERFVLRMPRGYFLAVDPVDAARHFATIAPAVGSNEVRTSSMAGARAGTQELLVVAADRQGLLSWIAGALALAGLSILTAQAFTTADGVAVDLFEVEGAFEPEVAEWRWREFRSLLEQAVVGRTSLDRRVADKRGFYPSSVDAPITVSVDNDASEFSTVIEVGAADRIGLLYDITSALAELRLDVHLAKVVTYPGRVIDAFYVRDGLGRKVTDRAQVGEIEDAVRARLAVRDP
jgi:[protein-PII] uridylyltransferase